MDRRWAEAMISKIVCVIHSPLEPSEVATSLLASATLNEYALLIHLLLRAI